MLIRLPKDLAEIPRGYLNIGHETFLLGDKELVLLTGQWQGFDVDTSVFIL